MKSPSFEVSQTGQHFRFNDSAAHPMQMKATGHHSLHSACWPCIADVSCGDSRSHGSSCFVICSFTQTYWEASAEAFLYSVFYAFCEGKSWSNYMECIICRCWKHAIFVRLKCSHPWHLPRVFLSTPHRTDLDLTPRQHKEIQWKVRGNEIQWTTMN